MDLLIPTLNDGVDDVSPLVASVSRQLTASIESSEYPIGKGLPSERRLASEFGVSRGVIRAVIKKLTNDGLIEAKPNCRPVVRTASPAKVTGRRHLGIWLWPNTSDFAATSILKGIQRSNLCSDVRLVVASALGGDWDSIYDSERRFLESLAEDPEEAGAIVWYLGGERNQAALQKLRDADVPIVFVDRLPPKGFDADFVGTNNESAAEQIVKHLVDLGHRRVGLVTNMDQASSVAERERGYHRALKQAGIRLLPDWIQRVAVDEPSGVKGALDALLSLTQPPTAIFCINDHLGLQVYEELGFRGLRIPGDISLVGFDGLLRWLPGGGYLTTASQDFERIGQLAAELAIERIAGGKPNAYRHYLLDAPILNRSSSGRVVLY